MIRRVVRGGGGRGDAISSVPAKKVLKGPDPRPRGAVESETDVDEIEVRGSGPVGGRSTKGGLSFIF